AGPAAVRQHDRLRPGAARGAGLGRRAGGGPRPGADLAGAGVAGRGRRGRRRRRRGPGGVGRAAGRGSRRGAAPGRGRAGGPAGRAGDGHGPRGRQGDRGGRPRGLRGGRLRPLLRRPGRRARPGRRPPGHRRRPLHAVAGDGRDPAVELPGRHPHGVGARRAGRRLGGRRQHVPAAGIPDTAGDRLTPPPGTDVPPPRTSPVAIPMGSVLAALAAGSAVVVKPAPAVPACTEVAAGAVHAALAEAGVPREVLQVVRTDEGETGRALVSHPDADTVLLTGSIETARLFSGWRADRPGGPRVIAETSGKNAVVVTPAADYDLAVADVVRSAFGHAGQKCSAASLLILVGSAGRSERLRRQL